MQGAGRQNRSVHQGQGQIVKKIYEWNMQELGDTPQSDKNHKSWTQKEEKTFKPKMKLFFRRK